MTIVWLHLATVLPAFLIGTVLLLGRKGTPVHRCLGSVYLVLMFATASVSLALPATVGPRLVGSFGIIHVLSAVTLVTVPLAWFAARRGRLRVHRDAMVLLYVGGLLVAGGFALSPGRLLHAWLF